MSSPPVLPPRQYSFTNHSINAPSIPQPGDKLDEELDNSRAAIQALISRLAEIQRPDGHLANQSVRLETLAPDLLAKIISTVTPNLTLTVANVANLSASAAAAAAAAQGSLSAVAQSATDAQAAASNASISEADAQSAASIATSAVASTQADVTRAASHANHALGSENAAHMSAEMAMAWAEYLPDTIPPQYFPDNAVTGDHWSARWWANKAANAFGHLTSLYLGVHPDHATAAASVTNPPLAVGAIYYNSTESKPYIWDGKAFMPFWSPQKAITTSLFYRVTAPQTDFVLGTPDLFTNSFTLDKKDTEPVELFVNGIRMFPASGTPATGGDYTIDVANNKIVMSQALGINAVVTIDILTPRDKFAVGSVNFHALLDLDLDPATRKPGRIDGVETSFSLMCADGTTPAIGSAVELFVSVDGVIQQAGKDYNVVGTRIRFTDAPRADSKVWALWMEPSATGSGGKGVQPPAAPDDLHTNAYEWDTITGGKWNDNRGRMHSVANAAARLALKDPVELIPGALVYERDTHDIWAYTPPAAPGDPTKPTSWSMLLPGHPSDGILRALEYDPAKPLRMAWNDVRDVMETVPTEADLSNRAVLPLSHLAVGKLIYVRSTGTLWESQVDGATGTATNTIADFKELGGAGVTYVARAGNLPDPTTKSIPDGSLFMVNLDLLGQPYHRLYVFDATATNAAGVKGIYRPAATTDFTKALRTDPDHGLDSVAGDLQVTLENGHKELKAFDAGGAWQVVYSEDQVKAWIAAASQLRGTLQETGGTTVGTAQLGALTAQSALNVNQSSWYYIWTGQNPYTIPAAAIGGAASGIDGRVIHTGDWVIIVNTGTTAAPNMRYEIVPADLLSKSRGDGLYGLNPWAAGGYEAGSLVVYAGDVYKASRAVVGADPAPGAAVTTPGATNPWAKVDLSGGVKNVANDGALPAGAPNGAVYLVLSSARAGGKQALYSWDQASSTWSALGGGGIPLTLTPGKKLQNIGVPIGTVISFAGKVLPAGYLMCDGASFDAAVYVELAKVLGGNVTPDLRGQFIMGAPNLASVNFTKVPFTTGMPKNHFTGATNRTGQHTHDYTTRNQSAPYGGNARTAWEYDRTVQTSAAGAHEHTVEITGGGDPEGTKPDHVVLCYLVKCDDTDTTRVP